MAKGTRKRANTKSPNKITKNIKVIPKSTIPKDYPVRTLNAGDVNQLQQLVGLSNNILKLIQQCGQADKMIAEGNKAAKDMMQGKIKGPVMKEIAPKLYVPMTDMLGMAKKMKTELEAVKKMNDMVKLQLTQQYNGYIASMRNVQRLFEQILLNAPKEEAPKVIFEKDINKLTKKDKEFINTIKKNIDKKSKK